MIARFSSDYRSDIDGLRAVAVLSVVAYHVDEALVPGGFTGVDIFFVISGYLITTILKRDILAGSFSVADFYRKRLLRIAPAYFAVTIATLLAGSVILLPEDMRSLAASAGWSALALPNVFFWLHLDTGYFAASSNQVPLLHLWSLGVEEQFYVLWPLALLVLGKWIGWRGKLLGCVVIIATASFALGQYAALSAPSFAYYMLPARAGELLVGGLLALHGTRIDTRKRQGAFIAEGIAVAGLLLLAWGLFGLDGQSLFPGTNALFPTVGSALLILAGTGGTPRVTAFLRLRPMLFIGLISYSLYLWHWPILALMRYFSTTLTPSLKLMSVGAMLFLAYASYRWIEVPFRHGVPSQLVRRHALVSYAAFVIAIGSTALGVSKFADLREGEMVASNESELEALKVRMQAAFAYDYNCQRRVFDPSLTRSSKCVVGDADAAKREPVPALLMGDSNAAHYIGVLGAIAEDAGFAFRNLSLSSCPPIFGGGTKYGKPTDRAGCALYRNEMRKLTAAYPYVLLGAQWSSYSKVDGFEEDLRSTLDELGENGATVVILGQVPRFSSFNQNCELARVSEPNLECAVVRAGGTIASINEDLKAIAEDYSHVRYMDVSDVICPERICSAYIGGAPIYYDKGHLSMAGSWDVGRELVRQGIPLEETFDGIRVAGSASPITHSMSDTK